MFDIDFRAVIVGSAIIGAIILASIFGIWKLVDWLFIDDAIKVNEPLKPIRIELVVENNKIDTLYVYELP